MDCDKPQGSSPEREGATIDATAIKTPLRKNLGNKNCETNEENRRAIVDLLMNFEANEQSKIFDNREFGYWQITVERPLRLRVNPDGDLTAGKLKEAEIATCQEAIKAVSPAVPLNDWNQYAKALGLKAAAEETASADYGSRPYGCSSGRRGGPEPATRNRFLCCTPVASKPLWRMRCCLMRRMHLWMKIRRLSAMNCRLRSISISRWNCALAMPSLRKSGNWKP